VFAFVFTDALTRRSDDIAHITRCYDRSVERIAQSLPSARVHCEDARRSPHIIALDIAGIESQMVVAMLDARDMCISRGSACASGASTPSHVLLAMGIDEKDAMSTIRLSFHPGTTEDDIDTAIDELSKIVTSLAPRETAGVS
jgi:cysteine desulfurase